MQKPLMSPSTGVLIRVKTSLAAPLLIIAIASLSLGAVGGLLSALVGVRASGVVGSVAVTAVGCGYYQAGPCTDGLTPDQAKAAGYPDWRSGACSQFSFCTATSSEYALSRSGAYGQSCTDKLGAGAVECGDGCCPNGFECGGGNHTGLIPHNSVDCGVVPGTGAGAWCRPKQTPTSNTCSGRAEDTRLGIGCNISINCPTGTTCGHTDFVIPANMAAPGAPALDVTFPVCVPPLPGDCNPGTPGYPLCSPRCGPGAPGFCGTTNEGSAVCCSGANPTCLSEPYTHKVIGCGVTPAPGPVSSCPTGTSMCGISGSIGSIAFCCPASAPNCANGPRGEPMCY